MVVPGFSGHAGETRRIFKVSAQACDKRLFKGMLRRNQEEIIKEFVVHDTWEG